MIGLFMNLMRGPAAILASVAAIVALCGCLRCFRKRGLCRLRDCACLKRFLRWTGTDEFDDFELTILVHEVMAEQQDKSKMTTSVRVTAGCHTVRTDKASNGIFQQPLAVTVEQGTDVIVIDWLSSSDRLLATLSLDSMEQLCSTRTKTQKQEQVFSMKQKGKGIRNPKLKLTMVSTSDGVDEEQGLLPSDGFQSDVGFLVRQQLQKARQEGSKNKSGELSELEVLKQACSGPLEIFEGLGSSHSAYVGVLGPPVSRRWALAIWKSKHDFDNNRRAAHEVDLLKIQSVQPDPTRHHVFVINYYDDSRVRQVYTFRRVDRNRDVWVEILHLLVAKAHEARKEMKANRQTGKQPVETRGLLRKK